MEISINAKSKDYFSTLNALAQKIATDIEQTQEAYQNLWQSLSKEEQNQVIDESIISPSAVLKYAHLNIPMIRESPHMYSWFTKSQLDLFHRDIDGEPTSPAILGTSGQNPLTSSVEEVKDTHNEYLTEVKRIPVKQEERFKSQTSSHKSSVLKPKTPPPPPPAKIMVSSAEKTIDEPDTSTPVNDIPKTGFDFLDNW